MVDSAGRVRHCAHDVQRAAIGGALHSATTSTARAQEVPLAANATDARQMVASVSRYIPLSLSHHARDRDSREPERLTDDVIARVSADEAQMIQTTTANAATMALRLPAENRWCVSGTPIQANGLGMHLSSSMLPTFHRSTHERAG